jgi:flagellar motility protein MotE (MotC chaperone)
MKEFRKEFRKESRKESRKEFWKKPGIVALLTFVFASSGAALHPQVSSSEDTTSAPASSAGPAASSGEETSQGTARESVQETAKTSACLSDPIVLDEIKKKHEEIDRKWKELTAHEAEIKAREVAVDDELKKLQQTRDEIAKLDDAHTATNQEKITRIVETLEGMNPKAASQMLSNLNDALAVQAMSQMSTQKLSKVMNVMEPERASKLTEILAGVPRAKRATNSPTASNGAAEATIIADAKAPAIQKGEKPNDQQSESIISGGSDPSARRVPGSEKP